MKETVRKSGINVIGDVPWGTHFCMFYQTKQDLLDILVPYFKAGLESNEAGMWVVCEPLTVAVAREALAKVIPNLDEYINRSQMEILPYTEWYMKGSTFNLQRVLNGWVERLNQALYRGYAGMRVTGNTAWLEKQDWHDFTEYEAAINGVIGKYKFLALCTYSLEKCNSIEIIDVVRNHEFALIKQETKWELIENAIYKEARRALRESETKYRNTLDSIMEGCQIIGFDWRYLYINDAAVRHGRANSKDDLIGHTMMESYPGIDKTDIFAQFRNCMEKRLPHRMENEFTYPDGSRGWFDLGIEPVPEGIFILSADITERKRLEKQQAYLASFPKLNPLFVLEIDRSGKLCYGNPAVKSAFPEMEKRGLDHPFLNNLRPVLEGAVGTESVIKEVKVSERWYQQLLFETDGHLRIYGTDITELKKVEEALRKSEGELSTILASVPIFLLVVDPDRRVMKANDAAARFVGRSAEEMVGLPGGEALRCLHSLDDPKGCGFSHSCETCKTRLSILDTFATGNNHYEEEWHLPVSRDGKHEEVTILLSTVLLPTPKKQVLLCIEDITERKRAEQEIKELNENLKRRAAELEAANRELESFSYSVSHDLRAPLRSLDGFSQAIMEDYGDKLDDDGKDFLRRIRESSQLMGQLIDDMLTLSQVTRIEIKLEKLNLSRIAQTVANELKNSEPKRDVQFVIQPMVEVYGDANLLKIVMGNLFGNAWKFTRKRQHARIEFGLSEVNGAKACYVRDNGAGFNMQYAHKLFTPFQRLHSITEFAGTGIGLASVARIIHRLGGKIWTEGEVDKGATFYFALNDPGV